MISTFSGLFQLLDIRAISHVDRTATATYYQSHRSMLHIYSILPTFGLSYHWRLSSHDIPTHFAIFIIWFRIFSPFYIYLTLPYPHKKRIEERFIPPIVWDYCDFTATAFPLRLRLTPRTAASSYQPSTHYRVFYRIFYRISIDFLLHRIAHLASSHRT